MAISQSNYVDITSAVAGAAASGSPSLHHRRFSPAASLTVGLPITIMASQLDQLDELLTEPEDRAFARQYFGIKTTAPANKPSSIQFVGYTGLDLVDSYMMSRAYSKDFGSLSFRGIESVTDTDALEELADYQSSLNVQHQLYVTLSTLEDVLTNPVYTAFAGVPMVGFVLNGTASEYKEAIPAGLIAATDFEGTNTVNSIMYRQASGFTPDVDNDMDKLTADSALVNYYGQTAANATLINFFQKGVLNGGVADPRDMMVAAGEQWIKSKVGSDLINLFVASRVPANLDGQTRVRTTIVNGAIQAALGSGAIQPLKELTQLQREVIYDMTNDENAASDVFQEGYWLNVEIRTVVVDGLEERHAYYTLIYSKADFVRKVVGSQNLI